MLSLVLVALMQGSPGVVIPAPRGYVNDFAGVVDAAHAARIEQLATYVQAHSKGEIAIVTMRDIGQHDVGDVALQIGRQWGVGSKAPPGDRARNAGVVVLVIPGAHQVAISVGQGAEGFIPDAVAGDIRREATPLFQAQDYGGALELITARLVERYANEFQFSLDSAGTLPPRMPVHNAPSGGGGSGFPFQLVAIVVFFVLMRLLARGGRGGGLASALPWMILGSMGRGGGSGGGFGGFGGGGGGFGGFGGGGGFSGGGSSGSW